MAILDELTEQEVSKNKAIRGYIVRALAKGSQNALLVRQITNALVADGLIYSPDISKPIEYLQEAGYVTFTDRSVNAYNAYRKDSIIKLTRKGVSLEAYAFRCWICARTPVRGSGKVAACPLALPFSAPMPA